jgi:hypothetical protein
MNIVDYILSQPDHIDFYVYTPGSGGEFFSSLIALSHKKTNEVLKYKSFEALKNDNGQTRYSRPQYLTFSERINFLNVSIKNEFYGNPDYFHIIGHQMPRSDDRINFSKMILFQSMLENYLRTQFGMMPWQDKNVNSDSFESEKDPSENFFIYKGTNIILSTHWIDSNEMTKMKDYELRNFGLVAFEKEKYWDLINLDPISENGINLVLNFCRKFKLISDSDIKIPKRLNHKAFRNIKLKFPFMDYMADNDLNSIKDYIENRYGSDLDYDFIDQALIDYKKIRIDPYL